MDDRQQTQSDAKSSRCLWQGELKNRALWLDNFGVGVQRLVLQRFMTIRPGIVPGKPAVFLISTIDHQWKK